MAAIAETPTLKSGNTKLAAAKDMEENSRSDITVEVTNEATPAKRGRPTKPKIPTEPTRRSPRNANKA